jgi:glutathionyl-hydroquinone reductase
MAEFDWMADTSKAENLFAIQKLSTFEHNKTPSVNKRQTIFILYKYTASRIPSGDFNYIIISVVAQHGRFHHFYRPQMPLGRVEA